MAYRELLLKNSLSLLALLEWLIDLNLAIVYLPANFFIKMNSQNYCNFYVRQLYIFKYFRQFLKIDFCETCITKTSLHEVNQCGI